MSKLVRWWHEERGIFDAPVAADAVDYEITDDLWRQYEQALEQLELLDQRIRAEGKPLSDCAREERARPTSMPLYEHGKAEPIGIVRLTYPSPSEAPPGEPPIDYRALLKPISVWQCPMCHAVLDFGAKAELLKRAPRCDICSTVCEPKTS